MALENGPSTNIAVSSGKDSKSPQTSLLTTHTGQFIFGPASRVKFKIVEEESGVETTYFKIEDLPYMKSDGRQMIPHDVLDGEHKMLYYSVDKQGNEEEAQSETIYVDKKGPNVMATFNASPISFADGVPVFLSDIQLTVEVTDEKVQVQKVMYQINEGAKVEGGNSFSIDLSTMEEGKITIELMAYDSFYNITKEIIEFKISR